MRSACFELRVYWRKVAAREARQAALERERAVKKRVTLALETRRAEFRRRRGSPPDVHWNYIEALRGAGAWCGDDAPDWKPPSWMQKGYDPMANRDYWLARFDSGEGALD